MVGYLSKKPKLSFVDDPGKLYRQRRRATQAKGLETLDTKAEVKGPSESPRESPPPSPKEDQPQPPPMGEQPTLERKIELCTPDIIDLPIINLQDVERPFKIKVTTIRLVQHSPFTGKKDLNLHLQAFVELCQISDEDGVTQHQMRASLFPFSLHGKALRWFHTLPAESKQDWEALMRNYMKEFYSPTKTRSSRNKIYMFVQLPMEMTVEALERFNEYMRTEFLEWHIDFLKRRMEKMEKEKEAQDLKAAEARSTFEKCEEYGHVQGKPRFNASSSIQDLVPLCTQVKDFMDEQAKINKDVVTKFEAMEKILDNLDGKVMDVGSSIREVFIVIKMLETQVEQLVGRLMGSKGRLSVQSQGPEKVKATQTHSGVMEDHTEETTKIMTEGPEFEMPSHYMKEVVASVKTKGQSQPVKTKNMTKPKNKPVPKMVRKWIPKIAMPAKSVDPK
jgi:hypothetical protein